MKRKMLPPLATLFLMMLFFGYGHGQTTGTAWYVDSAANGGSGTGTSWTNAWRSFSSVNWTSIKPGDTIYVSGGSNSKTYTESWSVGASGTVTNPITITIDATNPSHNGTVIFDYNQYGDAATVNGITVSQDYITFNGNVGGQNHIQINNLRNIYNSTTSIGISSSSATGIVVDHLTFINDNNPIRFLYPSATIVRNCTFQGVRGDAAIGLNGSTGSWDANQVYNNSIELLNNTAVPPGGAGLYYGPDGVQGSSGVSIFNNKFTEVQTSLYTSTQHPDMMQITGNYEKVYGNTFTNVGDSVFDYDCYSNANPHDVWIYNNIFRIVTKIDAYPEYVRLYTSGSGITSINNFKILNNIFVDDTDFRTIRMDSFKGNPTASGVEIKNNVFYNSGGGSYNALIYVDNSAGFNANSFAFDGNVYFNATSVPYITFRGVSYTASNWVSSNEPHGKTTAPVFVSYSPLSSSNDFHLQTADTVARDAGLTLSNYFSTDKDGVTRPQGPAWDIGPYEYVVSASSPSRAQYSFSEGQGLTSSDDSGNGNTLSLSQVTWTAGQFGSALSFNGTSSYASANDSSSLDLNGPGTIEAWIKPAALGRWGGVLAKGSANNDNLHDYGMELTSGNSVLCVLGNGTAVNTLRSIGAVTSTTQFTHIACTWDGSTVKVYINGSFDSSIPQTFIPAANTAPLYIGQYGGGSDFFSGVIDEVRIYASALSQTQIQSDMVTPIGSSSTPDTTAPSVPTLTAVAVSSSQINLSWTASTDNVGVVGYYVYEGTSKIATVTTTSYQDGGLTPSTTYTYTAAAYDAAGNISPHSNPASATTQAPPLPPPAAAYSFSEGQGSTSSDVSGNVNTLSLSQVTWTAGQFGSALSFNGTSSYASANDSSSLDLNGPGTIEAWIKPAALGRWGGVLAKGSANNDNLHDYGMELTSGNYVLCVLGNGTAANTLRSIGTVTSTTQFTHIACTWDGSTVKVYINGSLDSSIPQAFIPAANTAPLYIGQYGGGSDFFSGAIDEVRIYGSALSQTQIQSDMTR